MGEYGDYKEKTRFDYASGYYGIFPTRDPDHDYIRLFIKEDCPKDIRERLTKEFNERVRLRLLAKKGIGTEEDVTNAYNDWYWYL